MDNDIYLNFIYELVKTGHIKEKTRIGKFLKDKKIEDKDIEKKIVINDAFVCFFELEDKRFLIVKDFPVNFLMLYTILIGENTSLLELDLTHNGETKKCICEEDLLSELNNTYNEIITQNIKKIRPQSLFNKTFNINFKQPQIVENIKEYVNSLNKLELNKIHLTKSDKVEIFLPTIKEQHLKLAREMNIPVLSLLENNFIKDSTINIYDTDKIKEIVCPVFILQEKKIWDFYAPNKLKLYKDILREYILTFDKEKIIDTILRCPKTNFDKEKLASKIKSIKMFELTSNHGKYPFPIWKAPNRQTFISIQNTKHFSEITGVDFELDDNFLSDIYIQTLSGNKALYKQKFLKKEFEDVICSIEKSTKISFKNTKELILKIIYNHELGVLEITKIEDIKANKISQLYKKINTIIKNIIKSSIEYNKIPSYSRPKGIFEMYYFSSYNSIKKLVDEYNRYPSKDLLLNKSIQYSQKLSNILLTRKVKQEELYFLSKCAFVLMNILKEFDLKLANEMQNDFNSYFREFDVLKRDEVNEINLDLEKAVDDICFYNLLNKKKNLFLIFKKKVDLSLFSSPRVLNENQLRYKSIVKPNFLNLKKIFKYTYKDIAKQIEKMNDINLGKKIINVKGREIELKDDFYVIFNIYKGYKVILDNNWFQILIEKEK